MQLPEKCKTQPDRKSWFQFVVEKRVKPIVKNIMHIQENEVVPKTSKFTCKCAACSKCISKQPLKFLSINFGTKNLCTIMQSPENAQKHINPRCYSVKTRERRGSSFSQLGLEPNHTGLTAQSLFFLEESCRVKRSDTQTFSNFSNYFKRVLKLQKRSSSFSK